MNREEHVAIFNDHTLTLLRSATHDLSWLMSRGYTTLASLKLVGDRYGLHREARAAVKRAACSDQSLQKRSQREVTCLDQVRGKTVWIDGFNVLITVERALRGDPVLLCRDGVMRDIAGIHGTYRRGPHTSAAFQLIHQTLHQLGIRQTRWLFDRPVSNSGRMAEQARAYGEAEVVRDPDHDLKHAPNHILVLSGDGEVIENTEAWFNGLAKVITHEHFPTDPWIIKLS